MSTNSSCDSVKVHWNVFISFLSVLLYLSLVPSGLLCSLLWFQDDVRTYSRVRFDASHCHQFERRLNCLSLWLAVLAS